MKKYLFIALAAAALTSCSSDETLDNLQGEAIQFGNVFINNTSRAEAATDPSYSTITNQGVALTEFNVYGTVGGVNIFNGNKVTKGTADYGEAWTLTGATQYWITGAKYKFVGVVDGNKANVTTTTTGEGGLPTSISYTVDGKTDLLCDVVEIESASASQDVVAFSYTHLLSKVKFSVKNTTASSATNYRITLTEAKLTNVYESGTYDVNEGKWTASTTKDYTLENLTIASNSTQYHSQEVLLIPGSAVGVSIKANIEATSDNGTSWTAVSSVEKAFTAVLGDSKTLEAAKAYNFIVEMGIGTEIQFTANQMQDWINVDTTTLNN